MTSEPAARRPTRTLARGLAVLEAVAASPAPVGPTEVAAATGLDKATASRLLGTLWDAGYLHRDELTRRYRVSSRVLRLVRGLGRELELRGIARPHLTSMSRRWGETSHLGIRDGSQVVYLDKVEPEDQPVRMVSTVGQSMPLHSTALGKAILAWGPDAELRAWLATAELTAVTDRTIVDAARLEEDLTLSRSRGYTVDDRENLGNVTCVGAPILGSGERVLGALSISVPSFRVGDRLAAIGATCRDAAREASADAAGLGVA